MKIIVGILVVLVLVYVGYLMMQIVKPAQEDQTSAGKTPPANNASIVDGKQVIEIRAKGGYFPRVSTAKAGIPTVLKFNTQGTFDCSSAVTIPKMKISQILPPSGVTEIDLGILAVGVVQGTCGMGMYPFELNIQS